VDVRVVAVKDGHLSVALLSWQARACIKTRI
jgi:hypothetical protein